MSVPTAWILLLSFTQASNPTGKKVTCESQDP